MTPRKPHQCNLSVVWQCKQCRGDVNQTDHDTIVCPKCQRVWRIVEEPPKK